MHGGPGAITLSPGHWEPTGRSNARPMTGSAKAIHKDASAAGLLRRFAPRNDERWRFDEQAYGADLSPNFSCKAGHSRSGLNGTVVKRMPVAFSNALSSAAAAGM